MAVARILAVDDEPDFELLITQRFRKQIRGGEFVFTFAGNGEEALTKLDADPDIDLILLDINMPVMDGLTMLAKLRERESSVRSIIVSAYGDMENLRTAMNRGAFDFVTKPVDLADLETTMRKTLADVANRRELERQRAAAERARHNLSRYFSPNIVEMLAAQDEPLGAVRRETVAVLFADIVGFTCMAETMTPEAVMSLLRVFHERMTAQIFACGGTVDKYIGDAIVAVFGVPTPSPADAANALTCADRMLAALDAWNGERARDGEPSLAIGIGLNYGPAVLGDVGSAHSMAFTVIGDMVNTASRLQQLTRTLETPLVVGEPLVDALRGGSSNGASSLLEQLRDGGEQILRGRAAGRLVRSGRSSRRHSASSARAKPAEVPKKMNWKVSASAARSPIAPAEAVPCKISGPSLAARIAPNTPTKVVPARLRTKLSEAVAAPSWSHSTAFCSDTVATGGTVPTPRPMIVSSTSMAISPERFATKPSVIVAASAREAPTIGITL